METGLDEGGCRSGRFERNRPSTVAIVGAGASGTLTAIALTRAAPGVRVVLVDDRAHGAGVAYSTADEQHRLNVPACGMSALADDAGHFVRWLAASGYRAGERDFVPRAWYGRYLRDLLADAQSASDDGVVCVSARATALGDGCLVLDGRQVIEADAIVLALGNPPPRLPGDPAPHPRVVRDPWAPGVLDRLVDANRVLLVGTGLTMVDVALALSARLPAVSMLGVSRTGLVPRAHLDERCAPTSPAIEPRPGLRLDELLGAVGAAVIHDPRRWRDVVDGLRPVTQDVWRSLSVEDRRRFLDGPARAWEVHRHRMAPAVAARLEGLEAEGRLSMRAARIGAIDGFEGGVRVELDDSVEEFSHVIACTGSDLDVTRSEDPLVRDLLRSGRARPHPLGIGFDVGPDGELCDRRGRLDPRVLTIGCLRRGALYETTAIPEIRDQAARIAEVLGSRATGVSSSDTSAAPSADARSSPTSSAAFAENFAPT